MHFFARSLVGTTLLCCWFSSLLVVVVSSFSYSIRPVVVVPTDNVVYGSSPRQQQRLGQHVFSTSPTSSFRHNIQNKPLLNSLKMASSATEKESSENRSNDVKVVLPDQETIQQVLQVAIEASKKAGAIILGNAGGAEVTKSKANTRDLLTLIDPLCEKTIKETVVASFPEHDFLGEEDVPPGPEASAAAIDTKLTNCASGWLWIVDPIDGTTNFVHGMPLSMPSIAATYQGHVMVGVIYDPHRDELFTATRGGGAFMNGTPIHVGTQTKLGDAVVAMGSPPGEESMAMSLRGVQALMPKVRTIRMIGSAALMLAWVANGRLTAYWEYDLSSWDIAAGALLIQEAGGQFTDLAGLEFNVRTRKICATNGKIHNELLQVLREEAQIV